MPSPLVPADLARRIHTQLTGGPALLALDYDGTLVPLAPKPPDSLLNPATQQLLVELAARPGLHVALVTGRSLEGLRGACGDLPGVELAVNGGLRLTSTAGTWTHPEALRASPLLSTLEERLAPIVAAWPGALLEQKELTLAVHFRLAPDAEETLRAAVEAAVRDSAGALRILRGKKVFEVQPDLPWDKGSAVTTLATRLSAGARVCFAGDDAIDEPAFTATRALGGLTVAVGDRPSEAEFRLSGPAALVEALARFHAL